MQGKNHEFTRKAPVDAALNTRT